MSDTLDVLLIHLPFYIHKSYRFPHLGLLYVAASLRENGYKVGVLDYCDGDLSANSLIEHVIEKKPEILGFHVNTDSFHRVCRAIDLLQESIDNLPLIIFGGPHVTIEDREILENGYGDIVVRGEGEITTLEIARWKLKNEGSLNAILGITYRSHEGDIIKNPGRDYQRNLDSLPEPCGDLLLIPPKRKTFHILTGRGCPYKCAFCAEGLSTIHYRFRSPDSVLDEIEHLIGERNRVYLGILDDTFLVDRKRVEAIAKGIQKRFGGKERLIWFCEGRVDFITKNRELFPLLNDAGLVRIQLGIESGSQEILDLYGKQIQLSEIEEAVCILRDADIPSIFGNFIIGGARASPETVQSSIDLVEKLITLAPGRMEASASMLAFFPGTKVKSNPELFGLEIIDPRMLRGISLQHPAAVTQKMGKNDILDAYSKFTTAVAKAYEKNLPQIPPSLISRHIKFKKFGLSTNWSQIFSLYPTVAAYFEFLNKPGYFSMGSIQQEQLLDKVPHRTAPILNVDNGNLSVNHPREVIFNDLGGQIYELCSGKLNNREIISELRTKNHVLPPDPYFTDQVFEVMQALDDRFLLVFSDL